MLGQQVDAVLHLMLWLDSSGRLSVLAQWIGDLLALVVAFVSTRSLKMSQFWPDWFLVRMWHEPKVKRFVVRREPLRQA
jgi:hypothetical protein